MLKSKQLEGSHSGLVRIPGKDVCPKGHREFESLTLRQLGNEAVGSNFMKAKSGFFFLGLKKINLVIS